MSAQINFIKVKDSSEAQEIESLSQIIWHHHYDSLIGRDQVDYMLATFQSPEAILNDIEEKGYEYFLLVEAGNTLGYYAVCMNLETSALFLSKFYILASARGRGLARMMLDHMIKRNKPESIWLTVNKNNTDSIAVYEHLGFKTEKLQKVDIGSGFFMDDHLMRLSLII